MIKQINIKNFQSHKDSTLEFSEDVTAIVGLNNHGKSVVLRALQKCIRDIPNGTSFITDTPVQENECNVTITSDEGIVIRKIKNDESNDANMYIVDRGDEKEEYAKFGRTGIPVEVLDCLPTAPLQVFGDVEIDLNFANQLDPLFLMVGTGLPSLRGKVLGKASGVDKVQRAITIGSSEGKKLKNTIKNLEVQQDDTNNKLLAYQDLDNQLGQVIICENQWLVIKKSKEEVEAIQKGKDSIHTIVVNAKILQETLNKLDLTNILQNKSDLTLLYTQHDKAIKVDELKKSRDRAVIEEEKIASQLPSMEEFNTFLIKNNAILNQLLKFQQVVVQLNVIDQSLPRIDEVFPDLLLMQEMLKKDKEHYDKVILAVNNISATKQKLLVLDPEIYDLEKQEKDTVFELDLYKQEIKVCPTCNRPWEV